MISIKTFTSEEQKALIARADEIKAKLLNNCVVFPQFPEAKMLKVGDVYQGIWLEHNQDNLFLADYDPESAWASQKAFMQFQREDGLIPFMFPLQYDDPNDRHYQVAARFGQIQTIYPFTRCALEVAKKVNRPLDDFKLIYQAGVKYDQWLMNYRDHSNSDLVEMFCEYDTGHDRSPRVTSDGIPHACPMDDAVNMPDLPIMPVISADLSSTLYGGRTALADLAQMLNLKDEAALWQQKAQKTKESMQKLLYDANDDFYYDRDTRGLRKYKTEHITRLFLNKVLTQKEFDSIYKRYFTKNDSGFNAPYPFTSIAIDDPHFDKSCPKNSWGCNTQALTTLRAIMWMDDYNRSEDLTGLLSTWLRAICDNPQSTFQQELHPFTGKPIGDGVNYSPTLIIYLEAIKRLWGII